LTEISEYLIMNLYLHYSPLGGYHVLDGWKQTMAV